MSCISSVDGASLLFIDRVVDLAVMLRPVRTVSNCARYWLVVGMPVVVHVKVVDMSLVSQMQFPLVLTVQKTIVIPQLQSTDKVFNVPMCRSCGFLG